MTASHIEIFEVDERSLRDRLPDLGSLLVAIINSGVSAHFTHPYEESKAQSIFEAFLPDIGTKSFTWLAFDITNNGDDTMTKTLAGTVTLGFHKSPNGYHRAEIKKLLVHPDFQRRGIARKLMVQLEAKAREHKKRLLLLDTTAGYHAQKLYSSMGWEMIGICPDYASTTTKTGFEDAAFMYKTLSYVE